MANDNGKDTNGIDDAASTSTDDTPPPLPPRRPSVATIRPDESSGSGSMAGSTADVAGGGGSLLMPQSKPTTAVSSTRIQTVTFPDGSRGNFSRGGTRTASTPVRLSSGYTTPGRVGEMDDVMSIASFAAPTQRGAAPGDLASLLAGELSKKSPAWMMLRAQSATVQPFESAVIQSDDVDGGDGLVPQFEREFDNVPDEDDGRFGDEERVALWKAKLKHYLVLSSAGKPIYSRHGDLSLINSYMGVVQTIISFYEGSKNPLLGFTAGDARFVVATEGPLYFVAISRLGESDSQLRAQLEALYMQILSTLTLPTLTNIFANRPSTDLRRPLQGTESLLSSLADNFTKGSPSSLLGALECLKLRKSHRHTINNAFLKVRSDKLLYGLIVAGGKLVSVIRPRRHSLHPSDLQLIFNMLFESGGIKSGGGENWIPLCLPAFNNRGYLYMYVSFLDRSSDESKSPTAAKSTSAASPRPGPQPPSTDEEIAIILISPDKESFFTLQQMRAGLVKQLTRTGSLALIRSAAAAGRPRMSDVFDLPATTSSSTTGPASSLPSGAAAATAAQSATYATTTSHFLYKSRANVQFVMSSLQPYFATPLARRRLMTLYARTHAAAHARHSHLKVLHCTSDEASALAWLTPVFELYCVAGPNASRALLAQAASRVVQWARREEERLFIIGGAVF